MKSAGSFKKLGIVVVSSGCAALVISTIVIVASLSSIYGMVGECKEANRCGTRLEAVDATVHAAKFVIYASIIVIAGGVTLTVLGDKHKKP